MSQFIHNTREYDRRETITMQDDVAGDTLELTRAAAVQVAERVRRLTVARTFRIMLRYDVKSITRAANGRIMLNDDSVRQDFNLGLRVGDQWGSADLGTLDDAGIRKALAYAETLARLSPGQRSSGYRMPTVRLPVPEGNLWKQNTIAAMSSDGAQQVRSTALPSMLDVVGRTQFVASGFLGFAARASYFLRSDGPEAYYRETDVLCGVSARTKTGSSSGWAGAAARDWAKLDVVDVANRAVAMAEKALNPVALEPGRRTIIMSATACGQLVSQLTGMLNASATDRGMTPFSKRGGGSKLRERVADERIRLWSDPEDPMGGNMPFWGAAVDPAYDLDMKTGLPVPAMTWIDRGILTNLQYGHGYSLQEGKPWNRPPISLHLAAVEGTKLSTVDEMIANCANGIFVNRFSQLMPVDPLSGLVTGVTRDGCLFIKGGKITKSVKNFRFLDSPVFVLNKIIALGAAERVVTDLDMSYDASFPIIAPPLMADDFNFSSLSDAI